jgi:hypothetical protein
VNFKYCYIVSSQRFIDCILSSPVTIIYVNIIIYCFYLICNANDIYNFRKLLPGDDAGESKHVGVLSLYKILLIYIGCEFVGLDNKEYIFLVRL